MEINTELLKLIGIVGTGAVVLVVGFIYTRKKEKAKQAAMLGGGASLKDSSLSPTLTPNEEMAKNYIAQYKETYPRESLKMALVKNGNSEADVEVWLNKYF